MKKIFIILGVLIITGFVFCFIPFSVSNFIPVLKSQIEQQYGIAIDTNKLILKVGPSIVVKSPNVDLLYPDTKKSFANISGLKIKIAILPLIKHEVKIKDVRIDNFTADCEIDNNGNLILQKYLKPVNNLNIISKIRLKHYKFNVKNHDESKYAFVGSELIISDYKPNKHLKVATTGKLFIDDINHINYDLSIIYDGILFSDKKVDIIDFLEQVRSQQAQASIVADLKIKFKDKNLNADGTLSIDKLTFIKDGKKLPYSYANFTMLGDKTSIASAIYTNAIDKISVNGYFTNSDNPSFNISVKSNKINLKDLFYFARLFSDISSLNQIKDIDGTLYSDFTLKGTFKRLKSNGIFKVNNANIITDTFKINNLNADIDFSGNHILIKTAKAFVNNAPVIITGDIISNKLNINFIVDKFQIKNLNYQKIKIKNAVISVFANVSGSYKNIVPKIETNIVGCNGYYENIRFRLNNLNFKSINKNSGDVKLSHLILNVPNMQAVTIPKLNAVISDADINMDLFSIYSGKTKLDFSGKVLNYNNDKLTFSINGSGFANPNGIFNIAELDNIYPVYIEINGDKNNQFINLQALQQKSSAKISFGTPVIVNLSGKIDSNELKIIDGSINSYKGLFSNNLKKNIASSTKYCLLTGTINNIKNPELKNLKLNFLKTCPLNVYHYVVKVGGNIVINGNIKNPEIIGNIKLPIVSDKYGCLTAKNITLSLTKNLINFDCASVKMFDSLLSFVGTAEAKLSKNLHVKSINIKSKELDLDNLSLMLLMAKDTGMTLAIDNGTMFSESVLIQTPVETLRLTDLTSNFSLLNNKMDVNTLTANLYNGKVAGKISLNISNGTYDAYIQGRGVSAGPIMKSMTHLKETIAGKLDFDMDVESSVKSKFIKNGNIKFIIKEGQMSILGKVEHLLYAQNIVADNMAKTSLAVVSRAISAKDTGLFKYLNGIVAINDDIVTIKSMKMLGPNMSLYITGHYGLMSNIANVTVLGRLSNTLVSSLGSFGTFTMDKFRIALQGEADEEYRILQNGIENIPQLPQRNTKEFKAVISGPSESKSSVRSFMWISESEKEYRTKEVIPTNVGIPSFIDKLPY